MFSLNQHLKSLEATSNNACNILTFYTLLSEREVNHCILYPATVASQQNLTQMDSIVDLSSLYSYVDAQANFCLIYTLSPAFLIHENLPATRFVGLRVRTVTSINQR